MVTSEAASETAAASERWDFCIIGAGIAGASLAAELAPHARVLVLEMEHAPGYHSTGRSAAFWTESYGGPGVQPLTTASGAWFKQHDLVSPRGALTIGRTSQAQLINEFAARFAALGVRVERLRRDRLAEIIPGLRDDWTEGAFEPDCTDINVAGVHAHFLAAAEDAGAELMCRAAVARASHGAGGWTITLADGREIVSETLINAAGAWADVVAAKCGIAPLGITPMRRTVAQLRSIPAPPATLPLVLDVAGEFYFKPEGGRLWLSPHDETPCEPCDAAPEELDVAIAIDRLQGVANWEVEQVEHRWAGLRSFAPDRLPIYGRDPANGAFVWFAGQGGFGIQTSPAAARLTGQGLLGHPADAMTEGLDAALYNPARFG